MDDSGDSPDAASTAPLDPDTERRIESFVGDWLTDATVPGASLAVVVDDAVVYRGGFGARDLETNAPATPQTLYGVASCTKSVAGLAVLLLAERGALSVSDPVTDYLDGPSLSGADGPLTIHDLLTHASGVPSLGSSLVLLSRLTGIDEAGVPLGDREDFYRHLDGAQDEVAGPPPGDAGTGDGPPADGDPGGADRFMYCNEGYNLVGHVVEAVDGRPFDQFVADEILDPLGMERSTFDPAVTETADADAMTPYAVRDGDPEPTPFPHRPVSYAAGGLIAPVDELTRYLRLHAGGGSVDGVDLLPADALARAHEGHVERARGAYGYGWNRTDFLGRTLLGHSGSLGVSSAYLGFTADGAYGVAIGANTTPSPAPPAVGRGVLAILDGEDPADVVPHFARAARFAELTGEYESYRGIVSGAVERHGGALRLTLSHGLGEETALLLPTDPERPDTTFAVPTMAGTRKTATFEPHEDHVDLFFDRYRLHRQS
ncbi:MAG: serine hydrolase [Halobacteriaceae archaeon]